MVNSVEQFRECIAAACPELAIKTVELFRAGQNNALILVNEALIFRFPKYREGIAGLRRERAILEAVQGRMPLETPHFIYCNVDEEEVGRAFVGYRKLPGNLLWREGFAQISDEETVDRLATDIASFLLRLHAIPVSGVDIPQQPSDSQDGWREIFNRVQTVVYPRLTAEGREWTTQQFDAFLENDDQFPFSNVLRHGDMGMSNILYSAEQERFVGVVDFGHAGIGDPAVDFAGLYVCYGESFLKRCARVYPLIDRCWERIRFYADFAFLMEDALFCVEHGTEEADEVVAEVNRVGKGSGGLWENR